MRLLMSNYEFPPIGGGAGRAHANLIRCFAGNPELIIDVVTSHCGQGLEVEQFADNIILYKVGIRKRDLHHWRRTEVVEWLCKAGAHYRRLLKTHRYDLAHAFFAFPTGWLCWRTSADLPYVLSLRGSDVPGYNECLGVDYRLLSPLFKNIWGRASAVIANSNGLAALALRFMPDLEIGVIPNGVCTDTFHPAPDRKLAAPLRLLTVCRLTGRKRVHLIIETLAELARRKLDAQLDIVGGGSMQPQLTALAAQLGLSSCVNFHGAVPAERLPALYRESDVFLMASTHEGMSNAMLEAMASGLPIVTTRCEGVDELITDNGLIVEVAGPKAFADALCSIVANPANYNAMSAAARRRSEEFTWGRTADLYLRCYSNVLQGRPRIAGGN
ncbi:MAG: glycosyltransferase [Anaerohalosphaeraceae bacterium]|jgi:glycosyltransferase involved in cell wall biosynthesis